MSAIHVRTARVADAHQIAQWEALFPSDRLSLRSVRRLLASASARLWVAEDGSALLGNLVLLLRRGSKSARIYSLFVAPGARGRGVAEQLVTNAERHARDQGRERIVLEVRTDALPAQRLYRRLGYAEDGSLQGYYDDGGDGLRMVKRL